MSSPVDHDHDQKSMYNPPYSRRPSRDPSDAVFEAAERLKQRHAAPDYEERLARRRHADEVAEKILADDFEAEMGKIVRDHLRDPARPSALDPVAVPPPPKHRKKAARTMPPKVTWPMAARVVGAVVVAAVVAVFVSGADPLSSFGSSFSPSERNANAMMPETPRAARAIAAVAVEPPAPAEKGVALAAYTLPPSPATAEASTLTPADLAAGAPSRTAPPPAADLRAAAPEAPKPDRAEIAAFLKRGQDLIAQGDISGGRLLLQRAAEGGEAQAALALAATFDPRVLAEMKVIGVAGDETRARQWYAKASALGSAEATRRLAQAGN